MKNHKRKTTQLKTGETMKQEMKGSYICPTCRRQGDPAEFYATAEGFAEHFRTHLPPSCYTGCGRPAVFAATIVGVPIESSPTGVLHPPCCLECAIERGFAIPEGLVVA